MRFPRKLMLASQDEGSLHHQRCHQRVWGREESRERRGLFHIVLIARGLLPTSQVDAVRAAGHTDGEVAEIVGAVALDLFTNYFNYVAGTEIDFPIVRSTGRA